MPFGATLTQWRGQGGHRQKKKRDDSVTIGSREYNKVRGGLAGGWVFFRIHGMSPRERNWKKENKQEAGRTPAP